MTKPVSILRRKFMVTSALSGLATMCSVSAAPQSTARKGGTTLVAYFSRSGNTRVIAGTIQRAQDAALFEIQPARPYPDDYLETVEQARRERERGYRPPLKSTVPEFGRYQTIYLGFPIWGGTVPPVIRAFLAAHDFKGKSIIPFITHGGYGIGNSLAVLAADATGGQLLDRGLVMQADQERQTLERVTSWLQGVNSP